VELTKRKWGLLSQLDRQLRDLRHKTWRLVVDWCKSHGVSRIFVGNPHGVRDRNCGRKHNQRMANWEYGLDIQYLNYKAQLLGINVFDGSERGTSSHCPVCGHRHKPKGRNWQCSACGFVGHRDLVGFVNMHELAFGEQVIFPTNITYLQPEQLGSSSRSGATLSYSNKSQEQAPALQGIHLNPARSKEVV